MRNSVKLVRLSQPRRCGEGGGGEERGRYWCGVPVLSGWMASSSLHDTQACSPGLQVGAGCGLQHAGVWRWVVRIWTG